MAKQPPHWETYEQVAVYLLDRIAEEFGLEQVEGKQDVYGSRTGTSYEIDGKGVKIGGEGFVIIECRRYTKSKQKQEQAAALAFRILDSGAAGGILVSPHGLQAGAQTIAKAEGVVTVLMDEHSTRTDFMLTFLNKIFKGFAETARVNSSVTLVVRRSDWTEQVHNASPKSLDY